MNGAHLGAMCPYRALLAQLNILALSFGLFMVNPENSEMLLLEPHLFLFVCLFFPTQDADLLLAVISCFQLNPKFIFLFAPTLSCNTQVDST